MKKRDDDYDYYVFLDDDLSIDNQALSKFESILQKSEFPVIFPALWGYDESDTNDFRLAKYMKKGKANHSWKYQTVDWYDGAFTAFHRSSIHMLLPYEPKWDAESWYYSQLFLILKSNYLFRNQIVQINAIKINENFQHTYYPRQMSNANAIVEAFVRENGMGNMESLSTRKEIFLVDNECR